MTDRARWQELREDYTQGGLVEADLAADPFAMFDRWMADAIEAGLHEPNAMVLATVSPTGLPTSRMVLLKGVDERGFSFFTNTGSAKGRDLAANPKCSLLFGWHQLERQIRIDGEAWALPAAEVADYFNSRPRGAQIGAWTSNQSTPVSGREELAQRYAEFEARFADADPVPVPPLWGGYVVRPLSVEFWQGRPGRMHDRLVYTRHADSWATGRLAP